MYTHRLGTQSILSGGVSQASNYLGCAAAHNLVLSLGARILSEGWLCPASCCVDELCVANCDPIREYLPTRALKGRFRCLVEASRSAAQCRPDHIEHIASDRRIRSLTSEFELEVPFFRHDLSAADSNKVGSVLATRFLTSGNVGKAVERQLCDFFDTPDALLVNSWTNGALTTLFALGIGAGDEVIVPAMTFISTANVIEMVGARAVFVDVDPDTLLMTPELVRAALTQRTRAVIPVHLYGQMCDMPAIKALLADRPDVAIIEDAAHCFEGSRDGYLPGRYGDVAIFSFYATKNITCGEGGAVVVRNEALCQPLRQARLHGMTAGAIDRYRENVYQHWDMVRLGCKANLPDLLAALLPAQISTVREKLAVRRRRAERYRDAFADGPVRMPSLLPQATSAEHAFVLQLPADARDQAMLALNARGIGTGVHFRSVPSTTYYREKYGFENGDFPVSDAWGAGTLSLPLYPSLTDEEQAYVIRHVREAVYPLCGRA